MIVVLKVLLFVLCMANAVKLPGKCPLVPPTHSLLNHTGSPEIVLSIPFAPGTPTYLFRRLNETFVGVPMFGITEDNGTGALKLGNMFQEVSYVSLNATVIVGQSNESLLINGSIRVETGRDTWPKECHRPIQEEIRVWFEDQFVILWSCVDIHETEEHDEAAVLLTYFPETAQYYFRYQYERSLFNEMLLKLKPIAEKYLNQDLIDAMNWTAEPVVDPLPPWQNKLYWFPC